jgi:hypothetical protein
MPKFDVTLIETLSSRIEALPERSTKTPYEVVEHLAHVIGAACSRGQDIDTIVNVLKQNGIVLARSTVQNYLRRARKTTAAQRRAPPPPPVNEGAQIPPLVEPVRSARAGAAVGLDRKEAGRAVAAGHFELVPDAEQL